MNKFTLLLATAAALTSAQCPPNARVCGSDILPGGSLACVGSETELAVITPAGNSPANCIFPTNEDDVPQARGACCCADERCFANGLAAICD
ncbi:hypothetical protein QC761_507170 [Podospora bellae-mahoneyi]|uniref:Uncharacterized protein n=1 Tax=Podospora bellae-mahoneyi TaxID=2093777 RepID=A0ABR0FHG1_9PEZI|nr:hypothetical protein QC761_507170 [Podospora bellae-mahoneyi]